MIEGQKRFERVNRPIALNRKNKLFTGHNAGVEDYAMLANLIELVS
ncbi:hypothetical protein [Pseudovibrio denitrificans]|nr:hypothetical protein [Pseudovibrio denitrificans]